MNLNKKKRNIVIPVAAAFCFLYIMLAIQPMNLELNLSPEWTKDISQVKDTDIEEPLIPYRLGQNAGYFTPSGKIFSNIAFPSKVAISSDWYATYSNNSKSIQFYNPDKSFTGTIDECGFPFFDRDRIFVFLPGGTSFYKYNKEGQKMWGYESYAPVTSFSSGTSGTVAGFANGSIISFDSETGKVLQDFAPGGSEINVILGVGISEDGKRIASLSGQNQQRFVVAESYNSHSKVLFHEYLPEEINRQTLVKFNSKGNVVYYNFKDGLGIVDINKLTSTKIPVKGKVSQIEFSDKNNLVFVLSKDGNTYSVSVLENDSHFVSRFNFEGESAFIQVYEDALFIGHDTKISRLSIIYK